MASVVLLSGGLDSTVSLSQALREGEVKLCLTFDYGQRAAKREIEAASKIAVYYNLRHRVISLPFLAEITNTSLVNIDNEVPKPIAEELDLNDKIMETAKKVWVPNRNGLFINIAASFAESMDCQKVVTGFNAEEAKAFPDNSREFLLSCNNTLKLSTLSNVKVVSYTLMLDKSEIIKLGIRLGTPIEYAWPCYYGGKSICNSCESCLRYLRAIKTVQGENNN